MASRVTSYAPSTAPTLHAVIASNLRIPGTPAAKPRPSGGPIEIVVVAVAFALYYTAYFSPALLHDTLLAPGDGFLYYVPAFLSKGTLWNPDLYAGHPSFADAQTLYFNPLRLVGDYNAAVIAIYVLASVGAYVFVRYLTGLRTSAAIAGIVYGSGGAMVAHLGHFTIIYSAAWIPIIAWSIARARDETFPQAVAIGAVATACAALGGHPQIFVYGLALVVLYAAYGLLAAARCERKRLAVRYAILFGAGIALACVQLVPLAELGNWSLRERMTFDDFVSYALEPRGLLLFFFPRIFGSNPPFDPPYFSAWNLAELSTYVGISTLLLALAALCARRRERDAWFWLTVAVVAVAYAMGAASPLASIAFRIPGLNQFRATARTAFITTLALAVLAGYGWRAVAEHRLAGIRLARFRLRAAILLAIAVLAAWAAYPAIVAAAAASGVHLAPRLHNPAILVAVGAMTLSAVIVLAAVRRPSPAVGIVLVVALAVDLAWFGWFQEWRDGPSARTFARNAQWKALAADVRNSNSRVLFVDGSNSGALGRPNLNLLYDLPSASGYGPLILRNYAQVMGMDMVGVMNSLEGLGRRMKIAGADRLIAGNDSDRGFRLGGDCSTTAGATDLAVPLPRTLHIKQVNVISQLYCSVAIPQDAVVMTMRLAAERSTNPTVALRAGSDTAEWAIDRPDVASTIKHRKPADSTTYAAGHFLGHWYRSRREVDTDGAPVDVERLRLHWTLPPGPGINIRAIELIDESGASHRISGDELLAASLGRLEPRSLPGAAWVAHLHDAGRTAWLVDEVDWLPESAIVPAIWTGHLPDGRAFDPDRMALRASDQGQAHPPLRAANGTVSVERLADMRLRIDTEASGPAFLVVAQSYYPGWRATVDGERAPIVRTNGAFQGLHVPAGRHRVLFSFVPYSLYLGIAIAAAGVVLLIGHLAWHRRASRSPRSLSRLSSEHSR